jgi:hypothetical protein
MRDSGQIEQRRDRLLPPHTGDNLTKRTNVPYLSTFIYYMGHACHGATFISQSTSRYVSELWRMASSGMLRHVALVRTDVSEELSASFVRVTRIGELSTTLSVSCNRRTLGSLHRLLVTASVVPSSPILVTLMKEELSSSETSVLTRATQCNIPEVTAVKTSNLSELCSNVKNILHSSRIRDVAEPVQKNHYGLAELHVSVRLSVCLCVREPTRLLQLLPFVCIHHLLSFWITVEFMCNPLETYDTVSLVHTINF